jgi:hypothetical protein
LFVSSTALHLLEDSRSAVFVRLFWEESVERFIYLFMMKELFINPGSLSIIIVHIHRIGEMVK